MIIWAYRYSRWVKVNSTKDTQDPFLHRVRELEERFGSDIKLKERLSQFAKDRKLDKALIALWEEIESYPEWSSRENFQELNMLNVSGVSGTKDKDTESVKFISGKQYFEVIRRTERGWGSHDEYWAHFSLTENDDEVFAISCSVDSRGDCSCFGVSAFKNQGNWAKTLLQYYEQIRIKKEKVRAESKYWGADEIKARFKE